MIEYKKKKTKRNIILFLCVIIIAAILFLFSELQSVAGNVVIVEVDGDERFQLPLSVPKKVTISSRDNGENILVIQDGYAYMESSNCKNQICVHSKKISKGGESIVCLPHKVNVYILGGSERDMDAVTN